MLLREVIGRDLTSSGASLVTKHLAIPTVVSVRVPFVALDTGTKTSLLDGCASTKLLEHYMSSADV